MTGEVAAVVRGAGMRSAVASPIVVERRLWGAMVVLSLRHEPFPENTEARLTDFTELVATAIANAEVARARVEARAGSPRSRQRCGAWRRWSRAAAGRERVFQRGGRRGRACCSARQLGASSVRGRRNGDRAGRPRRRAHEVGASRSSRDFVVARGPRDGRLRTVRHGRSVGHGHADARASRRWSGRRVGEPDRRRGEALGSGRGGVARDGLSRRPAPSGAHGLHRARRHGNRERAARGGADGARRGAGGAATRRDPRRSRCRRRRGLRGRRDEVGKLSTRTSRSSAGTTTTASATAIGNWSAATAGVPVGTRSAVGGRNVLTIVAETGKPAARRRVRRRLG